MKKLFLLLTLAVMTVFSQNIFADDYTEHAKKAREAVWAWDRPEFKNYNVPEKYKNESAVIIAWHNELLATGKSRLRFTFNININKELYYTNIDRIMVKINDKSALEEYSEISYREEEQSLGYNSMSKFKTIVGARVIKPDGTIKEVNIEEAVSVTKDKKDKEDYKTIAISDLQVGDILDYFIQNEGRADSQNIPPLVFVFGHKYPMLSYSVHCELGRKLTTEYRAINGAPDFKVSTNDNDDVILDAESKNIPKIDASRWVSFPRQYPIIRLSVLNNASGVIYKPGSARQKGLHKDVPPETILQDAKGRFAAGTWELNNVKFVYDECKKQTKNYLKENPGASNEDIASYIFDALQYRWRHDDYYFTERGFILKFEKLLKDFKIEHKVGFVTSRFGARKSELANEYDLDYLITANNNKQIFSYPNKYKVSERIDYRYEGEPVSTVVVKKYKAADKEGIIGDKGEFIMPVSNAAQNTNITKMNVIFSEADPLVLDINRNTTVRGNLKEDYQANLMLGDDWRNTMRKRLGEKEEKEKNDKKAQKQREEKEARNEAERKKQKEEIEKEIKDYHDNEPKEVKSYEILNFGIVKQDPDFAFKSDYLMDGVVKKAGNNLILDAGKLIGKQFVLEERDRQRTIDAYITSARSYEFEISIKIPEAYTIENINNLKVNVDNKYGAFVSDATLEGNTLSIKAKKTYKDFFVPLAGWNQLVQMLDAANDFYAQSVILKKK